MGVPTRAVTILACVVAVTLCVPRAPVAGASAYSRLHQDSVAVVAQLGNAPDALQHGFDKHAPIATVYRVADGTNTCYVTVTVSSSRIGGGFTSAISCLKGDRP